MNRFDTVSCPKLGRDLCIHHGEHHAHKGDLDLIGEVIERDTYRVADLAKRAETISVIVDIGAHIGTFTSLASHFFPNAHIHSFEPDPYYFYLLALNRPENATLYNLAVLGFYGRQRFSDHKLVVGHGDEPKWRARPFGGSINALFLRILCPRIDFLKLDCEGCEIELLREMEELGMAQEIPLIYGEWHREEAKAEVKRILSKTHKLELIEEGECNQFYATRL